MKFSTIVIGAIKFKNQNYILNIIFFLNCDFSCEIKTMYQTEFFLQSWIQIRIKVLTWILKKVTKPKQKTKIRTKQTLKLSYKKSLRRKHKHLVEKIVNTYCLHILYNKRNIQQKVMKTYRSNWVDNYKSPANINCPKC